MLADKELEPYLTHSLRIDPMGIKAARIMDAALAAVDPYPAVLKDLNNLLPEKDLSKFKRIFLVGAGKAGYPMAEAAYRYLGDRISAGIVIVKDGYANSPQLSNRIRIIEASHPIPDQRGVDAADEIINLLKETQPGDLVICVISGGGSALLVSPVPGVSLGEIQGLTDLLLASGATINEINTLRKHLDQLKGGQLASSAAPADVYSLILSDVVGDHLEVIASGPTTPDPSTYQDALDILAKYNLLDLISGSIKQHLTDGQQGKIDETPKSGEKLFSKTHNNIIASNHTAARAAVTQAEREGLNPLCLTNYLQGEAQHAGQFLGTILRQLANFDQPIPRPACIIAGGETTVTVRGHGLGGRNQELALGAVGELEGLQQVFLITLATDGGDGPSDAAGAVVTGNTLSRARSLNLDPQAYLDNNDAYNFFLPLDDLIRIGPTQTNVNDLTFLFAF